MPDASVAGAADGQLGLSPGSGRDQTGGQMAPRAGRSQGALPLCVGMLPMTRIDSRPSASQDMTP